MAERGRGCPRDELRGGRVAEEARGGGRALTTPSHNHRRQHDDGGGTGDGGGATGDGGGGSRTLAHGLCAALGAAVQCTASHDRPDTVPPSKAPL